MKKIAIITVYNNEELYSQMKKSALERGGFSESMGEFVGLNNTQNQFKSAAEAYNYALDHLCNAEVFVFSHQDILFLEGSINRIIELCERDGNVLYGAAGVNNVGHGDGAPRIISAMASPREGECFTSLSKGNTQEIFTLDECLIAANSKLFQQIRFDEKCCDSWHLYAAELSLQCHTKEVPVRVFDANIVHLSGGNPDSSFYRCEAKIVKKYRKQFPLISYTCGWAYTNPILYRLQSLYRHIRYHI